MSIYLFLKMNSKALIDLIKLLPADVAELCPCFAVLGLSTLYTKRNIIFNPYPKKFNKSNTTTLL